MVNDSNVEHQPLQLVLCKHGRRSHNGLVREKRRSYFLCINCLHKRLRVESSAYVRLLKHLVPERLRCMELCSAVASIALDLPLE
jgi:hypothetical protein